VITAWGCDVVGDADGELDVVVPESPQAASASPDTKTSRANAQNALVGDLRFP
jgi:hypothetical protein